MILKNSLKKYSIGTVILAVAVVLFFVLSLGFITKYYPLFYDGNGETYELYMRLQDFNDFIFNASLVFAVLTVFTIPFDVHIKKAGILNILFLAGFLGYAIYVMSVIVQVVPQYIQTYTSMDLTFMSNYTPSTVPFTLCYVLIGVIVAVLAVLLGATVVRYVRGRKAAKEVTLSYE